MALLIIPEIAVYANLVPMVSLVFLLIMIVYNPTHSKQQTRLFQIVSILNMIMLVVISLDYSISISGIIEFAGYRRITSFLNFAVSPFIPLLLYKIFRAGQSRKIIYIPVIINTTLCFISMFNGIIFMITDQNTYARGPLFIIPFATTLMYLSLVIFQREYRYKRNKQIERLLLFSSAVCLSVGMLLEILFGFKFLTWGLSAICLFAYYLLLCIHNAILDPLTGAFNRIHYNKMLARYEHQSSFSIAMIDINDFKIVNDTRGHDAGDKVLKDFASLLEKHLGSIATIYRIGGDEFIVLARKGSLAQLESLLTVTRNEANQKDIDFAYGSAVYNTADEVSYCLEQADARMYEHKKHCKQKAL